MLHYKIAGLVKKDWKLLLQGKSYLAVAALLPLILGVVFVASTKYDVSNLRIGVCAEDEKQDISMLFHNAENVGEIRVVHGENESCSAVLEEMIKSGEIHVGIAVPHGFFENVSSYRKSRLVLMVDNTKPVMARLAEMVSEEIVESSAYQLRQEARTELSTRIELVKDAMELVETAARNYPAIALLLETMKRKVESVENVDLEFFVTPAEVEVHYLHPEIDLKGSVFIYLLSILLFFTVVMLSALSVVFERNNGFFSRMRNASIPYALYLLSKMVVFFLFSVLQLVVLLSVFLLAGASIPLWNLASITNMIAAIAFISFIYALIGVIIGNVVKESGEAVLATLLLALPMTFMTHLFYPLDLLSPKVYKFVMLMPINYGNYLLNSALTAVKLPLESVMWVLIVLFLAAHVSCALSRKT